MIDRHDEDGKAYIAYFRRDHTTGFIWTGNSDDPVQVTREMGEPVVDTFEVAIDQDQSTEAVLVRFKAACDHYLESWDDAEDLSPVEEQYFDQLDKGTICPRHDGPWGGDETCEHCTFEDGTPRPVDEPGPLGPGAKTWPDTDKERVAFVDWQYEVGNGDTTLGFRDWLTQPIEEEEV